MNRRSSIAFLLFPLKALSASDNRAYPHCFADIHNTVTMLVITVLLIFLPPVKQNETISD